MNIHVQPCGTLQVAATEMIRPLPVKEIGALYPLDNQQNITLGMNALLVEEDGRLVLLDPGCADFLPSRLIASYHLEIPEPLETSLDRLGYKPEEVTDVVFTHLHFDHGSGAFRRVPGRVEKRFPNADYHVRQKHFHYASHPDNSEANAFMTFLTRYLESIRWLEEWKYPWMEFRVVHGHTREMVVPVIYQENLPVIYLTDLVPMEIFLRPDVYSGYDLDPEKAREEKQDFLRNIPQQSKLIFYHDPLKESIIYT